MLLDCAPAERLDTVVAEVAGEGHASAARWAVVEQFRMAAEHVRHEAIVGCNDLSVALKDRRSVAQRQRREVFAWSGVADARVVLGAFQANQRSAVVARDPADA